VSQVFILQLSARLVRTGTSKRLDELRLLSPAAGLDVALVAGCQGFSSRSEMVVPSAISQVRHAMGVLG
jgi:hypothetical protein